MHINTRIIRVAVITAFVTAAGPAFAQPAQSADGRPHNEDRREQWQKSFMRANWPPSGWFRNLVDLKLSIRTRG